jgi:hypothetical protein
VIRDLRNCGIIFGLICICSLAGCQRSIPGVSPTDTPAPTATETLTPTATLPSTETPLPPVGALLISPEADPVQAGELQARMSAWIPAAGMRFQVLQNLTVDDLTRDEYQWVIAIPPQTNLGDLVTAAPHIRFLTLGIEGLDPAPNLTTINQDADQVYLQAFMAGYISAIITPDWRVGMIGLKTTEGDLVSQAFRSGVLFFCPTPSPPDEELYCRSTYTPIYQYPLVVRSEPGATEAEWQALGQYLITHAVETIYVMPGAGDDSLLRFLAESEINIIGGQIPPDGLGEHWVASIRSLLLDFFDSFWSEFTAGVDGQTLVVPVSLLDVNPDLLSPGRQRMAELMLADALVGYIDIGVDLAVQAP